MRWYQGYRSGSWRVDETYVRVDGQWKYLFRAIDKHGRLIEFMLMDRRNTRAAYQFLAKALKTMRNWHPCSITTDKLVLPESDSPAAARRQAIARDEASNIEVLEQYYRGRPRRAQVRESDPRAAFGR